MLKKIKLTGEQKKVLFLPPTNPIQIKGVAGSGKTTVALYRAKHLLETHANLFQEAKIIIFTFNKTLAAYLREIKSEINGGYQKETNELKKRTPDGLDVQIENFHSWAYKFANIRYDQTITQYNQVHILKQILNQYSTSKSNILEKRPEFFQEEISWMKGKLFQKKIEYLNTARVGRGTTERVTKADKEIIWRVFEKYNQELKQKNIVDFDDYAILVLNKIFSDQTFVPPYTHIIIDEAQDLTKAQVLAISKLVNKEINSITIIADAAQRIYKSGFVWSEVGINVRGGRTVEFKKNYRNSVHIARAALSLLDKDSDKSEFTTVETALKGGEKPQIAYCSTKDEQYALLVGQLNVLKLNNSIESTIVLHRMRSHLKQIERILKSKGVSVELLKKDSGVNYGNDTVKICTMSSVKGLEFNNVFILDLNDDILPFPPGFNGDEDEYHVSTERRLLYTCMTRAKSKLFLFSSDQSNPSRFLDEIDPSLLESFSKTTISNSLSSYDDDLPF